MNIKFDEEQLKSKHGIVYLAVTVGTLTSGMTSLFPTKFAWTLPIIAAILLIIFSFSVLKGIYKITTIILGLCLITFNIVNALGLSPVSYLKCSKILNTSESLIDKHEYGDALQLIEHKDTKKYCSECDNDTNAKRLHLLSKSLWREGKINTALEEINKAGEIVSPKNTKLRGDIYHTLGNIYSEKNQHNLAEKNFKKAIEKGKNSLGLMIDLSISQKNLGRTPIKTVKEIISSIGTPKTIEEQIVLSQAYRLMAYSTSNCSDEIIYYQKSFESLDFTPQLAERRLISYNDWVETQYQCSDYNDKIDLKKAYNESQNIASHSDTKKDIDRAKIDMSIKYAILFKEQAEKYEKNKNEVFATDNYKQALNVLNSAEDLVLNTKTDPTARLKWWMQKIDLSSRTEDLSSMISALNNASNIAQTMNFYDKKNISSLSEFYQIQGLIHYYYQKTPQIKSDLNIAKESLLKSYSIKYLLGQGKLQDLRRVKSVLEKMNITGLPDNYSIKTK